jgi:hypothetical protein
VRDPAKARDAFGEQCGLRIRPPRLDEPRDLTEALDGTRTVFIAMGSIGIAGALQRIAINAAAGVSSIEQVTCLSVLNTSADSLGINQRAHWSIDPVRRFDRGAVLDNPPRDLLGLAARRRTGGARVPPLDRARRQRSRGADRPSRRRRGRGASAH